VVIRARVWHLTIGYLALFAALAWLRTLFNGHSFLAEVGPITGPMYTLFVFFMVTDPRTIVSGRGKQLFVLLVIALLECAIRMAADGGWLSDTNPLVFAPGMYALFIAGPPFFWLDLRGRRALAIRASAPARDGDQRSPAPRQEAV
jgi:hypothetical protein